MRTRARIRGISCVFPRERLTNQMLTAQFPDWSVDKIAGKTGVSERGLAAEDETSADLGFAAAQKLLARFPGAADEVDFVLFCTQTPDYWLPATACLLQDRLGLRTTCGALDFNLGCSGFVYGLSLAKGLIETGTARHVLLITADTLSKLIHPTDRGARTLFSDAAAATLLSGVDQDHESIGPFSLGTNGAGFGQVIVPAGGFRRRPSAETAREVVDEAGITRAAENFYMDGPAVFSFALGTVPQVVASLLQKSGLQLGDVDYFVFHQANRFMLERLRQKIQIPEERFCLAMELGNTVSASIPIALEAARAKGHLRDGMRVMVVGFGVGLSWGAALIEV